MCAGSFVPIPSYDRFLIVLNFDYGVLRLLPDVSHHLRHFYSGRCIHYCFQFLSHIPGLFIGEEIILLLGSRLTTQGSRFRPFSVARSVFKRITHCLASYIFTDSPGCSFSRLPVTCILTPYYSFHKGYSSGAFGSSMDRCHLISKL